MSVSSCINFFKFCNSKIIYKWRSYCNTKNRCDIRRLNNTLIISRGTAVAADITNVQLWDKELIDSEVATLYNNASCLY